MNETEARSLVVDCLAAIAPEADLGRLAGDDSLRDELDLDSLDVLTLAEELARRTGQEVLEHDYPALATLDGAVALLVTRSADR